MSEATRRSGKPVPTTAQPRKGNARQTTLQPKMVSRQPPAANQSNRAPVAPPVYRPQPAPRTLQPKMQSAPLLRLATAAPTGIIQANIIGGTHALQARLNMWHTSAQRQSAPSQPTATGNSGANISRTPGRQAGSPQTVQRKSASGVEAFQVPLQPRSGGQPIPDQVRAKMETAFGMDFSDVRVHIGQEAAAIGAIAYTWGTNIHFAPGQYNPHTIQGQKLLGHELWHVVQQKSGRVSNPFGSGVAVVQDHALEAEADRMGVKAAMTALVQKPGD
ncbi:MAG TPA: DUF4157 domain-containing protein [Pyrinomonadaceae bacterium]|nr:DUF4157 domain-containing protein [Pyrinomonadaceae bacterium]